MTTDCISITAYGNTILFFNKIIITGIGTNIFICYSFFYLHNASLVSNRV